MKKVLSVLLILAAVFGFYGGAVSINDVLSCKDYWEEEGRKTTEDLNELEDGLNELSENTEAYLDGLDQVAQGEKDLAAGEKELAAGEADYKAAPGKLKAANEQIAAGEAELAAGKKALKDAEAAGGGEGVPVLRDIYLGVTEYMKAGFSKEEAINKVAAASAMPQIMQAYEPMKELVGGYSKAKAVATVAASNESLTDALVEAIYNNMDTALGDTPTEDQINTAASSVATQLSTLLQIDLSASIVKTVYINVVSLMAPKTSAQAAEILSGSLDAATVAKMKTIYDSVANLKDSLGEDGALEAVAANAGRDLVTQAYEGYPTYVAGKAKVEAGEKALAAGKKERDKGLADYKAAPAKLADGRAKLEQGRQDLADGKAKLAEYEDGERQLRDGLKTLMDTKADGGLTSIAERVGVNEDFSLEDGNFDFEAGYKGLEKGREYQSDSGDLITKELTQRAIGFGTGIGGGVLALIAAVLAFMKKNKGAGVIAILAAVAAAAGAFIAKAAGLEFSAIAGSALGATPLVSLGVLAGVALIGAIAFFAAPKAE